MPNHYSRTVLVLFALLALTGEPVWASLQDLIVAGETAYGMGDKKEAERLFLDALKQAKKSRSEQRRLATILNNLAVLYDETDRFSQSEAYYKQALAIREKAYGPNTEEVATVLNNLANLYKDTSRYAEAEAMYKRAIAIYSKDSANQGANLAMAYHNMAVLDKKQGKTDQAILHYTSALGYGEKALGPENSHVMDIVGALALLYDAKGDSARARPLFKRYLDRVGEEVGMPTTNPRALISLKEMARKLRHDGQPGNAELLEKAIRYQSASNSAK